LAAKADTREPYFAGLQTLMATDRHRPSAEHAEMDAMLEELEAGTLTDERRQGLENYLQAQIDDPEIPQALALQVVSIEEKARIQGGVINARLLLAVMPKVLADQQAAARRSEVDVKDALTR
jgi:hypothetical protein